MKNILGNIFETKTRETTGQTFICLNESHPHHEQIKNWVYDCHEGNVPHDTVYTICKHVARYIECEIYDNPEYDLEDIDDSINDGMFSDYVVYTDTALQYFVENDGPYLLDEYIKETGTHIDGNKTTTMNMIECVYINQMEKFAHSLIEVLKEIEETQEEQPTA